MDSGLQSKSVGQSVVAAGVVLGIAAVVAIRMGSTWIWRAVAEALDGAWDDIYDVVDSDDPDIGMYQEVRGA